MQGGMDRGSKLPEFEEFKKALQDSLDYLNIIDDHGSFDHELGRWQLWIRKWPEVYDEDGGL